MAYALGFEAQLNARQRSKVRKEIYSLYQWAQGQDYLRKFQIDAPGKRQTKVDVLYLNPAKFYEIKSSGSNVSEV
jgi:hypothetical protein